MPATYLPLNKIQYLSPRMDRIMKILTAIIVLGLAGVACAHRHCGAPAPSAGTAVTLPVRPDSGEVVMRSFAGTLPAEALCTLTVYMQRHSGDGVLHRHPRPRQRAECGKRQIIYAARPRRFGDRTIRRFGSASATTGSRYSIFLPATGPTAYSPYATNPTPSAIARWNRYGKRLHLIASTHGDKKAACPH